MRDDEIRTGRFYLGKKSVFVREVVARNHDEVSYLSYLWHDGSSHGDSGCCKIHSLATWAARELTGDEIARMNREQAIEELKKGEATLRQHYLRVCSTGELLRELRRRGVNTGSIEAEEERPS